MPRAACLLCDYSEGRKKKKTMEAREAVRVSTFFLLTCLKRSVMAKRRKNPDKLNNTFLSVGIKNRQKIVVFQGV